MLLQKYRMVCDFLVIWIACFFEICDSANLRGSYVATKPLAASQSVDVELSRIDPKVDEERSTKSLSGRGESTQVTFPRGESKEDDAGQHDSVPSLQEQEDWETASGRNKFFHAHHFCRTASFNSHASSSIGIEDQHSSDSSEFLHDILATFPPGSRVSIIFQRHAESEWNALLDRRGLLGHIRAGFSILKENCPLAKGSRFEDSVLSKVGKSQVKKVGEQGAVIVKKLESYLQRKIIEANKKKEPTPSNPNLLSSILKTWSVSPLTRAIQTTVYGIGPLLFKHTNGQIDFFVDEDIAEKRVPHTVDCQHRDDVQANLQILQMQLLQEDVASSSSSSMISKSDRAQAARIVTKMLANINPPGDVNKNCGAETVEEEFGPSNTTISSTNDDFSGRTPRSSRARNERKSIFRSRSSTSSSSPRYESGASWESRNLRWIVNCFQRAYLYNADEESSDEIFVMGMTGHSMQLKKIFEMGHAGLDSAGHALQHQKPNNTEIIAFDIVIDHGYPHKFRIENYEQLWKPPASTEHAMCGAIMLRDHLGQHIPCSSWEYGSGPLGQFFL